MEMLRRLFTGKERAYRVFWYWGGSVLLLVSLTVFLGEAEFPAIAGVIEFFYNVYCAAWSYAMWRCAYNVNRRFWGGFYRAAAIIMLLSVLVDVPDLWKDTSKPESLSQIPAVLNMLGGGQVSGYVAECQQELASKKRQGQETIPDNLFRGCSRLGN